MAAIVYSNDDYLAALQALLPRGRAWPRDPDAVLTKTLAGFAPSFQRSNQSASDLLVAGFPSTATDLLPEWEASLGLPRAGVPVGTQQDRQTQVVAAIAGRGGQSIAYFVALAASMGLTISITCFGPSTVSSGVSSPIYGVAAAFVWQVYSEQEADFTALKVMFELFKPAHTNIWWRVPVGTLLLESGDHLLLESGERIFLEY